MGRVDGIEMITPEQAIVNFFSECKREVDALIIKKLDVLGVGCIKRIRDRSASESWIDHSGNLRSSIGYSVLMNGHLIRTNGFQPTKGENGNGAEGMRVGKNYIEQVMKFYYQDYVLVVVAGMNYADYVEALENKDVLASTELWAKGVWADYQDELNAEISKKIKSLESKYGLS